jgi:uncharacterized OB-fold protein
MSDAYEFQKRMEEMQKNDAVLDAYSRIVSGGRMGYKAVIEKKQIIIRCKGCATILESGQKFCPECGTKVELPQKQ